MTPFFPRDPRVYERLIVCGRQVYTRYTAAACRSLTSSPRRSRRSNGDTATKRRRCWSGLLKQPGLPRDEQLQIRCALAEAWLLQDDIRQATEALGRPPEARERLDPARLSELWRMHGRLAVARGEPSRGIAFLDQGR